MYSAIVTGGSGEIGSEICRKLCEKGYAVAVCYNTDRISAEELVGELVSGGYSAEAVKCDVRDPSQIREAVHRASLLGDLAVAVNCAGTALYAQIQDTDDEAVQDIFAANSIGAYLLCSMILGSTFDAAGDVNGDGAVNIGDINVLINMILA